MSFDSSSFEGQQLQKGTGYGESGNFGWWLERLVILLRIGGM